MTEKPEAVQQKFFPPVIKEQSSTITYDQTGEIITLLQGNNKTLEDTLMELSKLNEVVNALANMIAKIDTEGLKVLGGASAKVELPPIDFDIQALEWIGTEGAKGYYEFSTDSKIIEYMKKVNALGKQNFVKKAGEHNLLYWLFSNGDKVGRKEAKKFGGQKP